MIDKIPVATDNIYKFYALFSLLAVVFSLWAILYVGKSANEVILDNVVEVETLKQEKSPTVAQQVRRAALEKKMEVAASDRRTFLFIISALLCGASWGMFYGFKKWHTEIQPVIDETARVQLEIAKAQLKKLQDEHPSRHT